MCTMKNVTLSMPDDLLSKSREYAEKHGTTLNEMIRDYLKKTVKSDQSDFIKRLELLQQQVQVKTKGERFDRDALYER
jgi:metal-responsive CopG/Arc/MetJ family transcriptional regulator